MHLPIAAYFHRPILCMQVKMTLYTQANIQSRYVMRKRAMKDVPARNTPSFAQIREGNLYYADKTGFLEDFFLGSRADVNILARPRRFGKTLLLSMMTEFLDITKDSRALFEGLAVSTNRELCKEWMNQYPVIFLSLREVEGKTFDDALQAVQRQIGHVVACHKYLIESEGVSDRYKKELERLIHGSADCFALKHSLSVLTRALYCHYQRRVIVLIDDYNYPLAPAKSNGYLEQMASFMRRFLSHCLSTVWGNLKFGLLTCCLNRPPHVASDLLVKSYTLANFRFADTIGFTKADVDNLLAATGLLRKKRTIRAWYGGYLFGGKQEMYCPSSVLNHVNALLDNPAASPRPYWTRSSKSALAKRFIPANAPNIAEDLAVLLCGGCLVRQADRFPNPEYRDPSFSFVWAMLYQSGCLTRASKGKLKLCSGKPEYDGTGLVIPNREMHTILADMLVSWFQATVSVEQHNELCSALWKGDAADLVRVLEEIQQGRGTREPDTADDNSGAERPLRENCCLALLLGCLLASFRKSCVHLDAGKDVFDIQVTDRDKAFILEVRRATRCTDDLEHLADEGLRHIATKRFDARLLAKPAIRTVLHWSVAVSKWGCTARALVAKAPSDM